MEYVFCTIFFASILLVANSIPHKFVSGGQTTPANVATANTQCTFAQPQIYSINAFNSTVSYQPNTVVPGGGPTVILNGQFGASTVYSAGGYLFPDNRVWAMQAGSPFGIQQTSPMPRLRTLHTLTAVSNTRFIACGGALYNSLSLKTCDSFENGAWSKLADMPMAVAGHTAAYQAGKLVIFGGSPWCLAEHICSLPCTYQTSNVATTQVYDVAKDKWTTGAPMPVKPFGEVSLAAAAAVPNTTIISVCGGYQVTLSAPSSTCYYYNVATNTWPVSTTPLQQPRFGHQFLISQSPGEVTATSVVMGGATAATIASQADVLASVETFTPIHGFYDQIARETSHGDTELRTTHAKPTRFGVVSRPMAQPVALSFAVQVPD